MHKDFEKYKAAIIAGEIAAKAADRPQDDGGTCNMDTVVIHFKGWRQKDIDRLVQETGIRIGDKISSGYFKNFRFIWFTMNGQADNRSRMVNAAYNVVKTHNLNVMEWLQCD